MHSPSRRPRFPSPLLIVLFGLGFTAGCTRDQWQRSPGPDDVVAKVQWFSTMHKGLAVQPYSTLPRPPVAGTVPVMGGEPELHLEDEAQLALLNRMKNPAPRTSASLERGKELFGIYCYPCHGPEGQADGPITPKFFPPPSLTAAPARKYTDGYIFTLIRYGRGIMPPYGDKVRGIDRWHLVNYIRLLQDTHK